MNTNQSNSDSEVIYVPDKIVWNIDRALDVIEKAQREFLKMNETSKKQEDPEEPSSTILE